MIELLLTSVLATGLMSLLSYWYAWKDILSGRPHVISLRQITGIMDRHVFTALLGEPKEGYNYTMNPAVQALFVNRYKWHYQREVTADGLCVLGSFYYLSGDAPGQVMLAFALLAGVCQGVNLYYSIVMVRRWWHQIVEEIEGL